jgi:hypothetical protein
MKLREIFASAIYRDGMLGDVLIEQDAPDTFSDSLVAGTGKAHDTLENTIDRLTRHGANVMARLSKSAVSRVLKSPGTADRRKSLLDPDELIELTDMLAAVLSTADLIGRARVRQSLAKRLGGWEKFADWDESEHPRDDEGQFVSDGDLSSASGDSGKADELRKRVTKPEERKKLEKAIGKGEGGSAPAKEPKATGFDLTATNKEIERAKKDGHVLSSVQLTDKQLAAGKTKYDFYTAQKSTDKERMDAIEANWGKMPPVIVGGDAKDWWITDGDHRLAVAANKGIRDLPAYMKPAADDAGKKGKAKPDATTDAIAVDADKARDEYKRLGTKAPAFKAWFGDSKVVDEKGEPLVVYHGTPSAGFDAFDPSKLGKNTDKGYFGAGHYFSGDAGIASDYAMGRGGAAGVYPVHLSIKKPFVFDNRTYESEQANFKAMKKMGVELTAGGFPKNSEEFKAKLLAQGYDGVVAYRQRDDEHAEYVAFEPTQIKSARGNRGTFDPKDKRIAYAETFADPPTTTPPPYTLPATIPLLPPEKALDYFAKLVPTLGVDPEVYGPLMKRRAFTLAVATDKVILENVQSIIRDSIAKGNAEVIADVQEVLDRAGVSPKNPQYAEMVTRTNTMDAYNQGHDEERMDPDVQEFFPVWRYDGIADERAGDDHRPKFGRYYPASASFADVRGERVYNCRCVATPIFRDNWAEAQKAGAKLETSW